MSAAMEALARTLAEMGSAGPGALVMGRVLSQAPLRVLAEGNAQDRDSLLRCDGVELTELEAGDAVALWAVEDRQRYVILGRVVEL